MNKLFKILANPKVVTVIAIIYGLTIVLLKPFISQSQFMFGVISETILIGVLIFMDIFKKQ